MGANKCMFHQSYGFVFVFLRVQILWVVHGETEFSIYSLWTQLINIFSLIDQ